MLLALPRKLWRKLAVLLNKLNLELRQPALQHSRKAIKTRNYSERRLN
jgi:hypothetical protein